MSGHQLRVRMLQKRYGTRVILASRLKCDTCGRRFASGSIDIKRGKPLAARCQQCVLKRG